MRAPSRKFRDELVAYRQKLVADNPGHSHLTLAVNLLDDWHDHGAAQEIWDTLQQYIPAKEMLTAEEFIFMVWSHRLRAAQLQQVVDELPVAERKVNALARYYRKLKNLFERGVGYAQIGLAYVLLGAARSLRQKTLSRKSTAVRNKFMRDLSAQFEQACGQPLDPVVATLTEIAFGETIDPEAVRAARRSNPTG